jgi:hypothetical protein
LAQSNDVISPADRTSARAESTSVRFSQFARDMILDAWLASAEAPVGYPMVNVRDIESGKVRATRELFGAD